MRLIAFLPFCVPDDTAKSTVPLWDTLWGLVPSALAAGPAIADAAAGVGAALAVQDKWPPPSLAAAQPDVGQVRRRRRTGPIQRQTS